MKNDEAVSTVVAMMLILGIIATLIAIYSATYLPELKQQSEIEHSREVANAFVRFGSDIDYVVSHKKTARFSEPFSLGGGDVILSPVRSSGLVTIGEERPLVNVTVTNKTVTNEIGEKTITGNASLVNVSYVPSFTTWEPQGYRWEWGVVLVTKDNVTVPQSSRYNTRDEALEKRGAEFLEGFIELDVGRSGDDLEITIAVANLTRKEDEFFITGSGIVTLEVNATGFKPERLENVTEIVFEDLTSSSGVPRMEKILEKRCGGIAGTTYIHDKGDLFHTLTFEEQLQVIVILRTVNVEVSVC